MRRREETNVELLAIEQSREVKCLGDGFLTQYRAPADRLEDKLKIAKS
jgi:hypothetical protein